MMDAPTTHKLRSAAAKVRRRIWEIVEVAGPGDRASRVFDVCILSLIVVNVAAVMLETVDSIAASYGRHLLWFEIVSVAVFTLEYVARVWSSVSDSRYGRPLLGRIRFMLRPLILVDLAAILPFYLPFLGVDLRAIRALRLMRIARLAKVGRYATSLKLISRVVRAHKEELVLTTGLMALLLVTSASLIYHIEHGAQPEAFPSIPATMWWAVVTLTTVGYGDVYPVTVAGKVLASIIAMLGIGMFALPTGILGAGFVEEVQSRKARQRLCPHCGRAIDEGL
jgi:voltage-gated potassium channel